MTPEYDIAMLLATRGRTESLGRSIRSLIKFADRPERLQLMFAFDTDDTAGTEYFKTELQPWLDDFVWSYVDKGRQLPNGGDAVNDWNTQRLFQPEWYDDTCFSFVCESTISLINNQGPFA